MMIPVVSDSSCLFISLRYLSYLLSFKMPTDHRHHGLRPEGLKAWHTLMPCSWDMLVYSCLTEEALWSYMLLWGGGGITQASFSMWP